MTTKTQQHTPGPWAIGIESDDDSTQVIAPDGGHICYVEYSPTEANAALIAAAPELLEALKRVREAFYVKGDSKSLRAAFEGTKELVAKAEGRA